MIASSINEISSKEIRNLVRGIVSASTDVVTTDVFDKLYALGSKSDIRKSIEIIAKAQQARRLIISLPFPPEPPAVNCLDMRAALNASAFLSHQKRRVEKYQTELNSYIHLIGRLNAAVEKLDVKSIEKLVKELKVEFGFSIHLTRKILSLASQFENEPGIISVIKPYYDIVTSKRNVLHRAIENSFAFSQDYLQVRRNFLRLAGGIKLDITGRRLIQYHFSPVYSSEEEWIERLRAHAAYSLPDLVMFVLESQIVGDRTGASESIAELFELPTEIIDQYSSGRTKSILEAFDEAPQRESLGAQEIYRHASAWLCDKSLASFFVPIERFVGPRFDGSFGVERPFITTKPIDESLLEDTLGLGGGETGSRAAALLGAFLGNDGPGLRIGEFQRTLILVRAVENGHTFARYDGLQLLSLLNKTQEVPSVLSELELDGAFPPKPNDALYEMLRTTLKFEAARKISTDFNMRSSTESLIREQFEGDILKLMEFIYSRAPEVASFYMRMWTEHFLVQCYKLYHSAYEVNEARRSLLEYYGTATNDAVLLERARSLGLENKLSLIRHDIDSQRLYVDLVRFKQWMLENLADPLRRIASSRTVQEVPANSEELIDEIEVIVNPGFALATVIDAAFHEFCCNKAYGVDSYIGRRIRHGTFHGTLFKGASDLVGDLLAQLGSDRSLFEPVLTAWLSRFDAEVKQFPQDRLQVRSEKKPRGLLTPHIEHAAQLNALEYAVEQVWATLSDRESIPEAVDIMSQACWLLLEPNLIIIRRELERLRREKLVLRREDFPRGMEVTLDDQVRTVIRRVNERVSATVQQISAWFAAPKETTPSATLQELFQVVRSEVVGQVPGFAPKVVEPEGPSIRILGHRYQYVYDALYILVHNAARHGRKGGLLELRFSEDVEGKTARINVTIRSELPDSPETVVASIQRLMQAPMDDALVTEGSTGIRKLRALASPKTDITNVGVEYDEKFVEFKFQITLTTM